MLEINIDLFESNKLYLDNKNTIEKLINIYFKNNNITEDDIFYIYYYYNIKREVIKTLFNVEWHSPIELNPDVVFSDNSQTDKNNLTIPPIEEIIEQFIKDFNLFCPNVFIPEEIRDKISTALTGGITFGDLPENISGIYHLKPKKIILSNNLKDAFNVNKTLFHELLHALSLNLKNNGIGFMSVYGEKARLLDEGIITILETKYDRYYNPSPKIKNNKNTNGYFIYKIVEQLEFLLGQKLFTCFFKSPEEFQKVLHSFIYDHSDINKTDESLSDKIKAFEDAEKVLMKVNQSLSTVGFRRFMSDIYDIYINIYKFPAHSANYIFSAENIIASQFVSTLMTKRKPSFSALNKLFNSQNYPNFDLYYDYLKQNIKNSEELNGYPELKKLYIFMEAFYAEDEELMKKSVVKNRERFLAIKFLNYNNFINEINLQETDEKEKYFYYLVASRAFFNTSLKLEDLFENIPIYKTGSGQDIIAKDYNKINPFIDLLITRPIYFIFDDKGKIIISGDTIYQETATQNYLDILEQNRGTMYGNYYKNTRSFILNCGIGTFFINHNDPTVFYYIENNKLVRSTIFNCKKEEFDLNDADKEVLGISSIKKA